MDDDLHVRIVGSGPAVLLLHAGISDGAGWMAVAEQLAAAGWQALVPDVRGFGASPDPSGPFSHADDAAAVLERAHIDVAPVVGWSMGGAIACALAHAHPQRVSRIALVNSVPPGFARAPAVEAGWEREAASWEAGDLDALAANDVATWAVGQGRSEDETPAHVRELVAATALGQARRWSDVFEEFDQTPAITQEAVRSLPIELVVGSEHDHPDVRAAADALGVRFDQIDRCGHAGPAERPDAYARILLSWLGEPGG